MSYSCEELHPYRLKVYRVFIVDHVKKQVDQDCFETYYGEEDVLEQACRKYMVYPNEIEMATVKKIFPLAWMNYYGDNRIWISEPEFMRYGRHPRFHANMIRYCGLMYISGYDKCPFR